MESATFVQSYPAVADSVPEARRQVVGFAVAAGADPRRAEDIRLSVSEALTNVVLHAYRGVAGQIHVRANVAGEELWVLIGDDGSGLQARQDSPGLGVGLALIAQTSDGLTIMDRAAGGVEVRMRFMLEPGELEGDYERGSSRRASSPAAPPFSTTR